MTKIGIIAAQGLGDGLICLIAAHNLQRMGYETTLFNDPLLQFHEWLKDPSIVKQPTLEEIPHLAKSYDMLLVEQDNSPKANALNRLPIPVFRFFGTYDFKKHGPITPLDYFPDKTQSVAFNLITAIRKWFGACSSENGLAPPPGLIFKKHPRRVAIHNSSRDPQKNWPFEKFAKVASHLQVQGFEPFFITTHEHKPIFANLDELASFLYESGAFLGNDSGPGHLASCLNIPSLIIGKDFDHLKHWQPGWQPATLVTPPLWSTYLKWTRKHWGKFITTRKIINTLKTSILQTK